MNHPQRAGPQADGKAPKKPPFAIAMALNLAFVAIEFSYGVLANSTALMADAGHNLSDVLGLGLAWGAVVLARRQASSRFTYGLRSSSILAALGNAVLLLMVCGALVLEAGQRLTQPAGVAGGTVMAVAAIGIVVNGLSAWLFMRGSQGDINIRGAYLHMLADAAVSFGVVVSGGVIILTQWHWLDPAISLVIVLVIVGSTWGLLRESVRLALCAVPRQVDALAVEDYLRRSPGVSEVHDLHIWGVSTTEAALTAQLVMPLGHPGDSSMDRIAQVLQARFGIAHSTLQVRQTVPQLRCPLETTQPSPSAVHGHVGHRH